MRTRVAGFLALALLVAPLAGCGGGGGGSASPGGAALAPAAPGGPSPSADVRITIPAASSTAAGARRAQFVGAAVAGVSLVFYLHGDTAHADPIASGTFDVSAGSGACTAVAGGRSCTLTQGTLAGIEDLVVTSYDAPPVAGSFASAHVLGIGTVYGVTIVAAGPNDVLVVIGGVVASIVLAPLTHAVAGGAQTTYALAYTAYDAAHEAIVAGANSVPSGTGTLSDGYANPITFTVSETGGSGHTKVSVNNGTRVPSLTVTTSNAAIAICYDGWAGSGYASAVTASAAGATSGITTLTLLP